MGLQYAVAQHSSPSPFISMAQGSVFNPSSCVWSSPICHPDHLAWGAEVNFLFVQCKDWAEIKWKLPYGRRNNDLTTNSSNSADWIALNGLKLNHGRLKVSRHLLLSPASSAFNVCSLSWSASCFFLLWSSSLICRSSATCWSSLSWAWRETIKKRQAITV